MAKRKFIKSIAFDIAHCFESRNNRLRNSWAPGPLYYYACRKNVTNIDIDLLSLKIVPEASRFREVIEFYSNMLQSQLVSRRLSRTNVKSATIKLDFDSVIPIEKGSSISESYQESNFEITVKIIDDEFKEYQANRKSWCYTASY